MRTATCLKCGEPFTTTREVDEHCARCQPALRGLGPEQLVLFPEAARQAGSRRAPEGRD